MNPQRIARARRSPAATSSPTAASASARSLSASLLGESLRSGASAVAGEPRRPPWPSSSPISPPRRSAVIHLFMAGAPSQLDLFDHKPELARLEGKPLPPSVIGGQRYAFIRPDAAVLGPRFRFARHGQCGAELSEMLPHLAGVVDDICFIKSMHTDQFNHAPAQIFLNTGFSQPGRPSLGSWVVYGLGSETQDLPAFVVMSTGSGISGGAANWSSGFLPTVYTGVRLRNQGDPILNVSSPPGIDPALQRDSLDLVGVAQSPSASSGRRSRDRHADRRLRDGLPAPDLRARADGPAERGQGDARPLRRRSRQALLRSRLPAGPADDRARRAVREHLSRRLGRPHRCHGQPQDQLRRHRPGRRGARQGPQAARAARRYPGDLGRRIRPDAHGREQRRPWPQPGPRPSSAGVHDVDGRRRHQARADLRRHRRPRASTSPRTPCTSTTSRPRSSTSSASTTSG